SSRTERSETGSTGCSSGSPGTDRAARLRISTDSDHHALIIEGRCTGSSSSEASDRLCCPLHQAFRSGPRGEARKSWLPGRVMALERCDSEVGFVTDLVCRLLREKKKSGETFCARCGVLPDSGRATVKPLAVCDRESPSCTNPWSISNQSG